MSLVNAADAPKLPCVITSSESNQWMSSENGRTNGMDAIRAFVAPIALANR